MAAQAVQSAVGGSEHRVTDRVELIAIMGATGAGKSTFINHVIQHGFEKAAVGHGQESCTSAVTALPFQRDSFQGSIIDTPGFDDTHLTDTEILTRIANWMEATYRAGIQITGILYLRDITEPRMKGSALKNLQMFRKLCGTESLCNVVIVTTKWDSVSTADGELREREMMQKFFSPMLVNGAKTARHDNTTTSAQAILELVLGNTGKTLQIQSELVEEGKKLCETEAGAAIGENIEALRVQHAKEKAELREMMEAEKNEIMSKLLEAEHQRLQEMEAQAVADKEALEASRDEEMAMYERRLEDIAKQTGCSTSEVLMKGLSAGFVTVGPFLLQQWQDWKQEQARERAEERAQQLELSQQEQAEAEAREARMAQEAKDQQIAARQRELEMGLQQAQLETVRLREQVLAQQAELSRAQQQAAVPVYIQQPGILELLLFGLFKLN